MTPESSDPLAPPPALRRRLATLDLVPAAARWSLPGGGRTSRVFIARGAYRSVVVKLARRQRGGPHFALDPVAEFRTLRDLALLGLTPVPLGHLAFGMDHCLVYRHVPGVSLRTASPDLARVLGALHGLPTGQWPRGLSRRPTFSLTLLARARSHLASQGWPERALCHVQCLAASEPTGSPRLVHGDPVPANALAGPTGLVLIDWASVHLGDPARDLAIALSPAMHTVYGNGPPAPATITAFLDACPDRYFPDRFRRLAPAFHLQMIGHCLWRIERGAKEYSAALAAETRALRDVLQVPVRQAIR
ncbi:MAG: aminoglycoside phosphotransferase family protein [Rhodobacteraceae bacterium]|nr:aminoglycoside phosphotransferase family protein [Paracoccaceae bacterium]